MQEREDGGVVVKKGADGDVNRAPRREGAIRRQGSLD